MSLPAELLTLSEVEVVARLQEFADDTLDEVIALTDNAALVNRLARVERGRRTERAQLGGSGGTSNLLPGRRLTQTELNQRSEERTVAEWVDSNPEEAAGAVKEKGWKKLVREARQAKREATTLPPPPLPVGVFDVLYADPPWRYEHSVDKNRSIENQYRTLTLPEICALEPPAATDAVLYLWATNPKLQEALTVVEAWGFTYVTNMVWVKDKIGMGYHARQRHELLLIATKGTPGTPAAADRPDSVIEAPRGRHSAKPRKVYDLIERAWPNGRYLELFARNDRAGWGSWGNEQLGP